MSEPISIQFTRFSAFYSPLIATIAGGFLEAEGFAPQHSVARAGRSAIEGVVNGTVHVCQSAPSQGFGPLEKGQTPPAMHFAQINERDGFFLTGRAADPGFTWQKLAGKTVLVDHGGQPLAMFKYACHRRGLDYKTIQAVDVPSGQMDAAFRKGEGDYIHQQGPAPQQLEHDRSLRLLEPRRHSRVARHGCGEALHARLSRGARLASRHTRRARGRGRGVLLPRDRPRGAHRHHRLLPEARLLDAARGDHPSRLRGGPRRLPARGAHHEAPPLRGRGGAPSGRGRGRPLMKTRAVASPAASLDELVTRRYPLEQINEACEALAHGEITGRAVVEL